MTFEKYEDRYEYLDDYFVPVMVNKKKRVYRSKALFLVRQMLFDFYDAERCDSEGEE